jgi:hypothetical protein
MDELVRRGYVVAVGLTPFGTVGKWIPGSRPLRRVLFVCRFSTVLMGENYVTACEWTSRRPTGRLESLRMSGCRRRR